ncbi:hypothetical protein SAMN05421505_16217 [Sinosporangium album]|uniref:Uncharacterized protein n=1 Tax=Sinosporangium album TaxID=504805 RepID=A0A1G8L877_9ACTN|nr:hypothetical protein [Sinosporangium album]SDI51430.1 hypothetical protein SAMN05421505_16217 [Sinosporangium album]
MSNLINRGRQRSRLSKSPEGDPAAAAAPAAPQVQGDTDIVGQLAAVLPAPYASVSEAAELSAGELRDLETCEAALNHLRVAFWAAGKALHVIRDARLYRATHGTFEEYCEDRWEMGPRYAYRLIAAWPIAERLMMRPIGHKITESHVRELLPLADAHGPEAAELVYMALADVDGTRVTAGLVRGAVAALGESFDPATAAEQIREFLALGGSTESEQPSAPSPFERQARRARSEFEKLAARARKAQRCDVRRFVTEMRALLDEIERSAAV